MSEIDTFNLSGCSGTNVPTIEPYEHYERESRGIGYHSKSLIYKYKYMKYKVLTR